MLLRRYLVILYVLIIFGPTTDTLWSQHAVQNIAKTETVRFIAFGDTGTGDEEQYAIAERMAIYHSEYPYDTVLMLGDNIYPDGNPKHLPEKFEKPYAELLRRGVRFYAAFGNHDVKKGREALLEYPHFNMGGRAYRSFIKGNGLVEFFVLDSTAFDDEQEKWLGDALANSKARWKIAYFHHPIYSSGRTHGSNRKLRARLEPHFVRNGVAVALSGHDHFYERTRPQHGIQYFVAGAGSGKLRRGNIDRKNPVFAAGNDLVCSFMVMEVTNDKIKFAAIDVEGNTLDSGFIEHRLNIPQAVATPEIP